MEILVTGGAGYIGSHFVKEITQAGKYNITVLDNLSRGHEEALHPNIKFFQADLLDKESLDKIFELNKFDAVVHFAAFAYVGESVRFPSSYYENNVVGSINLLNKVVEKKINKFIFSSTCSIYGNVKKTPISEKFSDNPINPYAKTKLTIENILYDYKKSYGLNYINLRYFNAAGADLESNYGESHQPETHLIPLVIQTALGERDKLSIFGNDYNTKDGTCIRDYIHVDDLANAHILALNKLEKFDTSYKINLGNGKGYSILDIIKTVERITNKPINFEYAPRRMGDPDILIADNTFAKKILNWEPKYNLEDIISSAWKWHKNQRY